MQQPPSASLGQVGGLVCAAEAAAALAEECEAAAEASATLPMQRAALVEALESLRDGLRAAPVEEKATEEAVAQALELVGGALSAARGVRS